MVVSKLKRGVRQAAKDLNDIQTVVVANKNLDESELNKIAQSNIDALKVTQSSTDNESINTEKTESDAVNKGDTDLKQ